MGNSNNGRDAEIKYGPAVTLKLFGFTRSGACNCGGTRNEIYKKDSYYLYLRKTRYVFKIKKKNEVVVAITPLANLETELKKLFPDVAVQKEIPVVLS